MSNVLFKDIRKYFTVEIDDGSYDYDPFFHTYTPKKGYEVRFKGRVVLNLSSNSEEREESGRLGLFVTFADDPDGDHDVVYEDKPCKLQVFKVSYERVA